MAYYPRCVAVLQVILQNGDPTRPEVLVVPVKRGTFTLNDYRHPDTFSLEFSSRHLPLDPDLIRTAAAECYLWDAGENTVEVEKFLQALDAQGDPLHLQVAGLVNSATLAVSSDGGTVSLEGEDYTSLLAAKAYPAGDVLPLGSSLTDLITLLVQEATGDGAAGQTLRVRWEGDSILPDAPTVGKGLSKAYKRGIPVQSGWSYWDTIYQLAGLHGVIAYVRGTTVVLAAPRNLTAETLARSRRVAYGRDLQSLEASRNMGHRPAPQVVASSYDPASKRVISASWPADAGNARHATGQKKETAIRVEAPPGVVQEADLQRFARAYHAQIARSESKFKFSTRRLRDSDGKDLIGLRAGDAIWIEWDAFRREEIQGLDQSLQFQRLVALGYAEDVAGVIVRQLDALAQFNRPFYVREALKQWDAERGIALEVSAVNFVEPAAQGEANPPPPPQTPEERIAASLAPVESAFQSPAFQALLSRPAVE